MPCEIEVFEQKGVVRKAGMGERMRGDSMIKQALPCLTLQSQDINTSLRCGKWIRGPTFNLEGGSHEVKCVRYKA